MYQEWLIISRLSTRHPGSDRSPPLSDGGVPSRGTARRRKKGSGQGVPGVRAETLLLGRFSPRDHRKQPRVALPAPVMLTTDDATRADADGSHKLAAMIGACTGKQSCVCRPTASGLRTPLVIT
jgi:hypothetical protein